MKTVVERSYENLVITQDLGLGMMLWMTCFFPEERLGTGSARAESRDTGTGCR